IFSIRFSRAARASSALGRLPNSRIAYSYSGPKRERSLLVRRSRMRYHARIATTMTAMIITAMPVAVIFRYLSLASAYEGPRAKFHSGAAVGENERGWLSGSAHPLERLLDTGVIRR